MLSHVVGEQPYVAAIFRGAGKCVKEDEKAFLHPDIDVSW